MAQENNDLPDVGKHIKNAKRAYGILKWLNPLRLKIIAVLALAFFLFLFISGLLMSMSDSGGGAGCAPTLTDPGKGGQVKPDGTITDNEDAKLIFDTMVKSHGFSGAGAAGVTAVVERESGFEYQAHNVGGGVAGWFQWSGWSHSVNGSRISSEGSIIPGDLSTLTKENQFKLLAYELNGAYAWVKPIVGNATDPYQAALDWSSKFEGVENSDVMQTSAVNLKMWSTKWYEKFGGAEIKPNPSLLGAKEGGKTGKSSGAASDNISCVLGGTGAAGYGLPVKGKYSLGMGTYPSYTLASTVHDHDGVDIRNESLTEEAVSGSGKGAEVYAIHNGKVESVTHNGDEYVVVIAHDDGKYSYYGHSLRKPPEEIKVGAAVQRGQHISYQGYGGQVQPKALSAAHVHLGIAMSGSENAFLPGSKSILSPAGFLPFPKEILVDGKEQSPDTRVTGLGFTQYFEENAK